MTTGSFNVVSNVDFRFTECMEKSIGTHLKLFAARGDFERPNELVKYNYVLPSNFEPVHYKPAMSLALQSEIQASRRFIAGIVSLRCQHALGIPCGLHRQRGRRKDKPRAKLRETYLFGIRRSFQSRKFPVQSFEYRSQEGGWTKRALAELIWSKRKLSTPRMPLISRIGLDFCILLKPVSVPSILFGQRMDNLR